jgi:hypothetical protein
VPYHDIGAFGRAGSPLHAVQSRGNCESSALQLVRAKSSAATKIYRDGFT